MRTISNTIEPDRIIETPLAFKNPISRLFEPVVTLRDEDVKFFRVTQIAYVIGLVGHVFAVVRFWSMGITEMFLFNAVVSIPAFLLALFLNPRGHHNTAFSAAFIELFGHQVLGTYFLGWDYGVQFWLFYLAGLCFFNPHWGRTVRYSMFATIAAALVTLFVFTQQGQYVLPESDLQSSFALNLVIPLAILGVLINHFARSAHVAEQELRSEKALTEQQNIQLSQQHDALVIEQEKTSRMLDKIQALFGQQVSEEVANELIQSPSEIDSKTFDATVMFLDIRDFTVFADSRDPAEVARFQNMVFGELIEIVRANGGVVLQILGDGIMAVFGAPIRIDDHAEKAVAAGYQMIDKVKELGDAGKIPQIRVGIGLNSGKIIAGNVGNESRRFYSLTGKNVIIAARIEQLNKEFKSQFLVSGGVIRRLKRGNYESLGEVALKGIEQPEQIFKLA